MTAMLQPAGAEPLVILTILDYAGIARGRGVTRHRFDAANGARTCGWVPANMSLTTFGIIADPKPWGSAGDLRLLPDARARYACWPARAATPLDLAMSDIVELDGTPWKCCPRGFLKAALADFMSETGCEFIAAFEQEFQILGAAWQAAPAFGVSALRRASPQFRHAEVDWQAPAVSACIGGAMRLYEPNRVSAGWLGSALSLLMQVH